MMSEEEKQKLKDEFVFIDKINEDRLLLTIYSKGNVILYENLEALKVKLDWKFDWKLFSIMSYEGILLLEFLKW